VHLTQLDSSVRLRHSMKRYTKFLLIGVLNAVVDLVVLNALLLIQPTDSVYWLSFYNTLAVVCAIINSYLLNRRWTFKDRATGTMKERAWFVVQALVNIGVNDLVMVWISSYLVDVKSVPLFISSNAAKALAMFISSSISFFLMKYVVFRGRRTS
jgi:putative flippase GtrA